MKNLKLAAAASALFAALAIAAIALADGPTRAEYSVRVEKICKPRAEATTRAMDGVRDDIKKHRYGVAAGKFDRAGQIFDVTVRAIAAVPQPSEDTTTLSKWLGDLKRQETYLKEIAAQLRAGEAIKAQHLIASFIHSGRQANNVSLAFDFNYCRFKFSRFN